jgi:hypothetical protein
MKPWEGEEGARLRADMASRTVPEDGQGGRECHIAAPDPPRPPVVMAGVESSGHRMFTRSAMREDMVRLGKDMPVLIARSGPFRGRIYQRTATGGIVRVR